MSKYTSIELWKIDNDDSYVHNRDIIQYLTWYKYLNIPIISSEWTNNKNDTNKYYIVYILKSLKFSIIHLTSIQFYIIAKHINNHYFDNILDVYVIIRY